MHFIYGVFIAQLEIKNIFCALILVFNKKKKQLDKLLVVKMK